MVSTVVSQERQARNSSSCTQIRGTNFSAHDVISTTTEISSKIRFTPPHSNIYGGDATFLGPGITLQHFVAIKLAVKNERFPLRMKSKNSLTSILIGHQLRMMLLLLLPGIQYFYYMP